MAITSHLPFLLLLISSLLPATVPAQRPSDDDPEVPPWCALPCDSMLLDVHAVALCTSAPAGADPRTAKGECICTELGKRDSSLTRLYASCLREARCSEYNWGRAWSEWRLRCLHVVPIDEEAEPLYYLDEPPPTVTVTAGAGETSSADKADTSAVSTTLIATMTTTSATGTETESGREEGAETEVIAPPPTDTDSSTPDGDSSAGRTAWAGGAVGAMLVSLALLWGA